MKDKMSLMSWSGGKDCAMALYQWATKEKRVIDGLFTSFNQPTQRVTMHGVHVELIQKQAEVLKLPIHKLELPQTMSHELYDQLLNERLNQLQLEGYSEIVFGDIFLEDLRTYRIEQLDRAGYSYQFPIWKRNTYELIHEFIDLGFKAIIVSLNGEILPKDFAGQVIDNYLVSQLPKNVDPCGENGEFHTFVFDGPIFNVPINYEAGEVIGKTYPSPVENEQVRYWFCDLKSNS